MRRGGAAARKTQKGGAFARFEAVLLVVCLCVLAVRATYIESPHGGLLNPRQFLTNEAFSLLASGVLILAAAGWLIAAFCRRTVVYRFSGIEWGLGLFLLAGLAATAAASNKRAAINDLATLIGPMAAAVMLVGILTTGQRVRMVLFVVFALAALTTWQAADQFAASNAEMIADYEADPQRHLEVVGAEPGSFEQWLYEHRLYSKDIRGFLTTSNSTGSLLLLAAFAATGFAVDCIKGRRGRSADALIACAALAAAAAWAGVVLVHSRGATGAAVVGLVMFVAAVVFGRWLWRFRVLLLILCVVGVAAAVTGAIAYGVSHDKLPGGASMLVRWQYWQGAAEIYADAPLTGVGGGNFATHYPQYKVAAALETVSDPHNFLLSLLSQYGPAGLLGFLAAFGVVLYRSVFLCGTGQDGQLRGVGNVTNALAAHGQDARATDGLGAAVLAATAAAMLIVRPVLNAAELGDRTDVMIYVVLILYVLPAAVFGAVFVLLWFSSRSAGPLRQEHGGGLAAGIFCGAAAVALHNIIDFAIFEPAVLTLLWMLIACLFAVDAQRKGRAAAAFVPTRMQRLAVIGGAAVLIAAFLAGALIPTVAAGRLTQRALNDVYARTDLLEEAAKADSLSPAAPSMAGKAYMQRYSEGARPNAALLERAADRFREAIERDRAHFKHYEKLGQVYELMAAQVSGDRRGDLLDAAFAAWEDAVARYPGSDRLHFKLAKLAEATDRREAAILHYGRAIEIEDAYRRQFAGMYPDRELFSRLGESNYQLARTRLAALGGE